MHGPSLHWMMIPQLVIFVTIFHEFPLISNVKEAMDSYLCNTFEAISMYILLCTHEIVEG